jgi:hypothetical protein
VAIDGASLVVVPISTSEQELGLQVVERPLHLLQSRCRGQGGPQKRPECAKHLGHRHQCSTRPDCFPVGGVQLQLVHQRAGLADELRAICTRVKLQKR